MAILAWGESFRVNSTTDSQQFEPAVGPLADGGFVAVWRSRTDSTAPDLFQNSDILAQSFGPDGAPRGPEVLIDGEDARWDMLPVIAGLTGGGFVTAWIDGGPGGRAEIRVYATFND